MVKEFVIIGSLANTRLIYYTLFKQKIFMVLSNLNNNLLGNSPCFATGLKKLHIHIMIFQIYDIWMSTYQKKSFQHLLKQIMPLMEAYSAMVYFSLNSLSKINEG
jgi:hypothetical protein